MFPRQTPVSGHGGALPLAVSDLAPDNVGEPRIHDLALAERLGFSQPFAIRKLIERNAIELEAHAEVFVTVTKTPGRKGGRPGREFWLTEGQALVLCALSRTPQAAVVRRQLIDVFMAWRAGHLAPPAAAPPAPLPPAALRDPVASALVRLLPQAGDVWSGTATTLLDALEALTAAGPMPADWPGGPQALSVHLRRLTPALRHLGVAVDRRRGANGRHLSIARTAVPLDSLAAPGNPLGLLHGWAAIGAYLGIPAAQAERADLPVMTLGDGVATTPDALAACVRRRLAVAERPATP